MKRRDFGLLAGTSLAAAAVTRSAVAQPMVAEPKLLSARLTPMGSERAGNADGSIPSWTGGVVSAPLPPDQKVVPPMFRDEQPLYTVNAGNVAQYQDMLTPGTQTMITKWGLSLKVFQTHRTAAMPQFVYDNIAKNVTNAKLDPAGGRLGFTGGYGGPPFPIIDNAEPLTAGAQLIWNHLTAWDGYFTHSSFAPGCVVISGKLILVAGTFTRTTYPYYAQDGSLESFDGYYSKGHYYYRAPGAVVGEETLVWHSTNVNLHPDIVWTLLNGQGRVRKAPNEAYDTPSPAANGIANIDESSCFYGNPSQYDWTLIEKREMFVPYNCNEMFFHTLQENLGAHFPNPDIVRWEKHRVWIVEANLHPGEHNVNAKRRLYFDEDTWLSMLGEGYDAQGNMVKAYANYNFCIPSLPGTIQQGEAIYDLLTGNYAYNGNLDDPPFRAGLFEDSQAASYFDPQLMAADASF